MFCQRSLATSRLSKATPTPWAGQMHESFVLVRQEVHVSTVRANLAIVQLPNRWLRHYPMTVIGDSNALLFGLDWYASNLCVQSGHCCTQALRDHLGVMLQSSLRASVPEVALHILNRTVVLHVR